MVVPVGQAGCRWPRKPSYSAPDRMAALAAPDHRGCCRTPRSSSTLPAMKVTRVAAPAFLETDLGQRAIAARLATRAKREPGATPDAPPDPPGSPRAAGCPPRSARALHPDPRARRARTPARGQPAIRLGPPEPRCHTPGPPSRAGGPPGALRHHPRLLRLNLRWKDRPSSMFCMGPAPGRKGVVPEGADGGPDEAASMRSRHEYLEDPGSLPRWDHRVLAPGRDTATRPSSSSSAPLWPSRVSVRTGGTPGGTRPSPSVLLGHTR